MRMARSLRKLMQVMVLVAGVAAVPVTAAAVPIPITPVNFDTLTNMGAQVGGSMTSSFLDPVAGSSIGTVVSSVYKNAAGIYTYVMRVTPSVAGGKEVNTGFKVLGFTGVAGWSYSQAQAAGMANPFSRLDQDEDGTIDWGPISTQAILAGFWNASKLKEITFFYQSTKDPELGALNIATAKVGTANVLAATVPEPGSLFLLGSGAVAAGAWIRRRMGGAPPSA
jgi:hypothetical protein